MGRAACGPCKRNSLSCPRGLRGGEGGSPARRRELGCHGGGGGDADPGQPADPRKATPSAGAQTGWGGCKPYAAA